MALDRALAFKTAGIVLALAFMTGCSDSTETKNNRGEPDPVAASEQNSGNANGECSGESCASQLQPYSKAGLAVHCSYESVEGRGCFTCKPHDIPREECVAVDTGFDPAKSCAHDLDLMTCKVTAVGELFKFDFTQTSQLELIYKKLPQMLLAAKVLIGGKLNHKPEIKEMVFGCLDSVTKHRKAVFADGDVSSLLAEFVSHVKKAKPEVTEGEIELMRTGATKAVEKLRAANADGKLEDRDFLEFGYGILTSLPVEMVGNTLESLNIDQIIASMTANGSTGLINDIITNTKSGDTGGSGSGTGEGSQP